MRPKKEAWKKMPLPSSVFLKPDRDMERVALHPSAAFALLREAVDCFPAKLQGDKAEVGSKGLVVFPHGRHTLDNVCLGGHIREAFSGVL